MRVYNNNDTIVTISEYYDVCRNLEQLVKLIKGTITRDARFIILEDGYGEELVSFSAEELKKDSGWWDILGENKELDDLSPNITKTVHWLREHGFHTTDSGDGTNFAAGMEGALEFPHVAMIVDPAENMIAESNRLLRLFDPEASYYDKLIIEVTYSPKDKTAILMLMFVGDSDLF